MTGLIRKAEAGAIRSESGFAGLRYRLADDMQTIMIRLS